MLNVSVTNDVQRDQFTHSDGALYCGRNPPSESTRVVIDDKFVSRDQFTIEEIDGGKILFDNRGRASVQVAGGAEIVQGESRELKLPAILTVGHTVVEVAPAEAGGVENVGVDQTLGIGFSLDTETLTAVSVTEFYPYPLAFGFRLLTSITSPSERYKEQLRVAENVLAFVASVSLALLEDEQIDQVNQKIQDSALSCWQGGISPGDWLTLSIHSADQLRNQQDEPLAQGLANLQINKDKKGFGKLVRELIKAKNDYKHDRGPSIESEYQSAADHTGGLLNEAFNFLSFIEHHRILLVQDVNPRRRGQDLDVVSLVCMGDHPGFSTDKSVQTQNLRKGDLYIQLAPQRLVPLFPFMHATTCSQCRAREFFFVDRLDRDRSTGTYSAGLKSFERGHTERDDNIGQEMQDIFAVR